MNINNYEDILNYELNKAYDKLLARGYSRRHLVKAKNLTNNEIKRGIRSLARIEDALFDNYEWVMGFTYDQ